MADNRVTLSIGGLRYDGWTGVSIERAIDQLAGSFSLDLTTRWTGQPRRIEIATGSSAVLEIGGEPVVNGWIDEFAPRGDAQAMTYQVTGRDRTADLVDCSAVHPRGSWTAAALATIVRELITPFGLSADVQDNGSPIRKFALQQGETVFEAIERLARFRGLLLRSDARGNLVLAPLASGRAAGELVWGRNLLAFSAYHGSADRYSRVIVKGQAAGDDRASGKAVAAVKGEASDPAVRRHRPLIVVAEDQGSIAELERRAQWEVSVRAARAQTATATVQGWRGEHGVLWQPGDRVTVSAPFAQVAGELVVSRAQFILAEERGTVTDLTLAYPAAYTPQPVSAAAALDALEGGR